MVIENLCKIRHVFGQICLLLLLVSMNSCGASEQKSAALLEANLAALNQSVDLSSRVADTDSLLLFDSVVYHLGSIPLGESRKIKVLATNISSGPLVILSAATSCNCTKLVWSKEPIAADATAELGLTFTAETEGVFFKKVAITHSAARRPVSFTIEGVVTPRKE